MCKVIKRLLKVGGHYKKCHIKEEESFASRKIRWPDKIEKERLRTSNDWSRGSPNRKRIPKAEKEGVETKVYA